MKINSIKFKNVFSFGAVLNVIDFNNISPSLFQIIGKNGVGKSSLLRILKISIYQEYEGVTIKQVANQTNKRGYIETNVDAKGHNWTIINEFSPDSLKIYKDGSETPEDLGGKNDVKEFIRNNITDIPYYVFCNLLSLSVNDFKSFLKMDAKSSRLIRDRIFGFYELNSMNEKLAPKVSKIQIDIDKLKVGIGSLSDNITNTNIKYDELKSNLTKKITEQHATLCETIAEYKQNIEFYSAYMSQQEDIMCDLNHNITNTNNLLLISKLANLNQKLEELSEQKNTSDKKIETQEETYNKLISERNMLNIKLSIEKLALLKEEHTKLSGLSKSYDELVKQQTISLCSIDDSIVLLQDIASINDLVYNSVQIENESKSIEERIVKLQEYTVKGETYCQKIDQEIYDNKDSIVNQREELGRLNTKLKAYKNGVCDVCQSDFTSDDHVAMISEMETEIEIIKGKINEYNKLVGEQTTKLNEAKAKISKAKDQILELRSRQKDIVGDIQQLSKINEKYHQYFIDFLLHRVTPNNFENLDSIKTHLIDSLESTDGLLELSELNIEHERISSLIEENKKHYERTQKNISQISAQMEVLSSIADDKKNINTKFKFDTEEEYSSHIKAIKEENDSIKSKNRMLSVNIEQLKADIAKIQDEIGEQSTKEIEFTQDELNTKLIALNDEHKLVVENRDNSISKIKELKFSLKQYHKQLLELSFDIDSMPEVKTIKELIDEFSRSLENSNKEIDLLSEQLSYNKLLQVILSDDGVKQFILKDFIPSINSEIGNILNQLGLPLVAKFDNDFKVKIIRFGEEVSISSISVGQKKMIDCAILLSIVTILKMKYSSINIIFYDEMFSSLDSDYSVIILEMVKKICCEKLKLHTLIVNHAYMPSNYFEYVIPIVNKNNFSSVEVLKTNDFISKNIKQTK